MSSSIGAIFHGDSSVGANLQFDGLDKQLFTNTIDKFGAALNVEDIWKAIKLIRMQGGQPTHVFCSYGVQNQLNSLLLGDVRYIAQQGTVVTMGLNANNIQTPAGVLPLVGDFEKKSPIFSNEYIKNITVSVKAKVREILTTLIPSQSPLGASA